MTVSLTLQKTRALCGKAFSENRTLSEEMGMIREVVVPAAKSGTLTTRTDANTGELTMAAGHGITTGARISIFWTEGGVLGMRRGVTVGTVATNAVPIDLGAGDDLPTNLTAVTACVEVAEDFTFDGDDIEGLVMYSERRGGITLASSGPTEEFHRNFPLGGQSYDWYPDCGDANPVVGDDIITVYFSNGSIAGTNTIRVGVLQA